MDEQFGGRTDDDLFYDDFEPVQSPAVLVEEQQPTPTEPSVVSESQTTQPAIPSQPESREPPSKPSQSITTGLSASRFAPKQPAATKSSPKPVATPPPNAPVAPREKPHRQQQNNNSKNNSSISGSNNNHNHNNNQTNGSTDEKPGATSDSLARLTSGANPRTKLTDEELAAKMEKMKLVSAEKARKFEVAQTDEKQHAAAYAKGMEEARKRRAEDAERRKQGDMARRRMEDEREKNRERKLKAMGLKEGGWDEGKAEREEEEVRKGFRGANGGIRGTRRGGGTLYPTNNADESDERSSYERGGRGRGRGRGGRGGRGGQRVSPKAPGAKRDQDVPTPEDFPALPLGQAPPKDEGPKVTSVPDLKPKGSLEEQLPPPSRGRWDDEMEEIDAMKQQQQATK